MFWAITTIGRQLLLFAGSCSLKDVSVILRYDSALWFCPVIRNLESAYRPNADFTAEIPLNFLIKQIRIKPSHLDWCLRYLDLKSKMIYIWEGFAFWGFGETQTPRLVFSPQLPKEQSAHVLAGRAGGNLRKTSIRRLMWPLTTGSWGWKSSCLFSFDMFFVGWIAKNSAAFSDTPVEHIDFYRRNTQESGLDPSIAGVNSWLSQTKNVTSRLDELDPYKNL